MKRAIIAAFIASTLMTGLAHAAGESSTSQAADSARTMDAPYIAVPVVRDGRLVNYLFVSVRVDIAQGVDLWRTREQAHFLRDAFIRAAHANQLASDVDVNELNEEMAVSVFEAAAKDVLGERAVRAVAILSAYSNRSSTT